MSNTWDTCFLKLARTISEQSKDPSTKTGAVIVRPDKSVASIGYNGFPRQMLDLSEHYDDRNEKYSRIIHCEMNALLFCRERVNGYTLYVYPFLTCDRCFVHVAQAGIIRIVAPRATEEQLTRWGDAFDRVRRYAKETNITINEVDFK